jgi:hypothetical protein
LKNSLEKIMKNEWGDQLELNQTNSDNQAYNPKQNRA